MNTTTSLRKKRRSSSVEDRRSSKRQSRKPAARRETPEPPSSPSPVDHRTDKCAASKPRSQKPSGGRETPEPPSSPSWVEKRADKCTGDHSLPPLQAGCCQSSCGVCVRFVSFLPRRNCFPSDLPSAPIAPALRSGALHPFSRRCRKNRWRSQAIFSIQKALHALVCWSCQAGWRMACAPLQKNHTWILWRGTSDLPRHFRSNNFQRKLDTLVNRL